MARQRDDDQQEEGRFAEGGDERLGSTPKRRNDAEYEDEDHPRSINKGITRFERSHLWSIAVYQKGILICILVYALAVVSQYFIPEELRLVVGLLVALPVCLAATVFVFLLATKVYNPVAGVILGFLTMVPCVGLIVLLIINNKATNVLKQHDISVGLLGASLADLN